jgi:D-3-phosphoglycerate dehydrogenase
MSNPIVLVTSSAVAEEALKILRDAGAEIVFMTGAVTEAAMLSQFARRRITAAVLRGPAPFTAAVLAAAKHLKIISKYGAGVDSVDIEAATVRGIALMVTNGANADAVAEHALALMLCLTRELPKFDREIRKGVWKDPAYLVRDFRDRTVGIVGYGHIGRRTARLASACGARVVIYSRSRVEPPQGMEREENLERLLGCVDILSLHCPLTDKTRGMIGEKQLQLMKPGALLINTARGKLIDEAALVAALKSGRLAGAGLDTFAVEPPDPANPLFSLPSVICTPHIAPSTTGAAALMGTIAANNIVSYLRGEIYDARNFLNPEVFGVQ